MWISSSGRAEIIVRAYRPASLLLLTLTAPRTTTATVEAGGDRRDVTIQPDSIVQLVMRPSWVLSPSGSHACVLSFEVERGFVPRLTTPDSTDTRVLGVLVQKLTVE